MWGAHSAAYPATTVCSAAEGCIFWSIVRVPLQGGSREGRETRRAATAHGGGVNFARRRAHHSVSFWPEGPVFSLQ
eukprot:3691614-Pyramimonas_sp.AAC.1